MVAGERRPRRVDTAEQKYHKALKAVEEIRSENCIETLKSQAAEHRRTKDPSLRLANNLYRNYMRKMKLIHEFESSDEYILMQQRQQDLLIRQKGANCQR